MVDVFHQPVTPESSTKVPVSRIEGVPHDLDPLRQGALFVLHGHVYKVLEKRSRGRLKIKHLGIAQA